MQLWVLSERSERCCRLGERLSARDGEDPHQPRSRMQISERELVSDEVRRSTLEVRLEEGQRFREIIVRSGAHLEESSRVGLSFVELQQCTVLLQSPSVMCQRNAFAKEIRRQTLILFS